MLALTPMSFYCNWGGTPETGWGGAQNFLNMDAGHAMSETNWNSVYSLITQCNEVITKYRGIHRTGNYPVCS